MENIKKELNIAIEIEECGNIYNRVTGEDITNINNLDLTSKEIITALINERDDLDCLADDRRLEIEDLKDEIEELKEYIRELRGMGY